MKHIEKAIEPNQKYVPNQFNSPFEWFINQNHIPFSTHGSHSDLIENGFYYTLYHQFLQELYELYLKTNSEYYWFNTKGKLITEEDTKEDTKEIYKKNLHIRYSNVDEWTSIPSNSIRLNKQKLRDLKIEQLLTNP